MAAPPRRRRPHGRGWAGLIRVPGCHFSAGEQQRLQSVQWLGRGARGGGAHGVAWGAVRRHQSRTSEDVPSRGRCLGFAGIGRAQEQSPFRSAPYFGHGGRVTRLQQGISALELKSLLTCSLNSFSVKSKRKEVLIGARGCEQQTGLFDLFLFVCRSASYTHLLHQDWPECTDNTNKCHALGSVHAMYWR